MPPSSAKYAIRAAVLPPPRRAIGLEERAAHGGGRLVAHADVRRPRDVRPPVAAALQARFERRLRRQHRLPLERRADQRPRILVLRRLERHEAARAAIRLPLAAELEHALELVVLRDLIRDLRGRILQLGVELHLLAIRQTDEARNQVAGRGVAMAGIEPQPILQDRSANFAVVVPLLGELVRARRVTLVQQFLRDVRALKVTRLVLHGADALERVAAGLEHQVHRQAGVHGVRTFGGSRDLRFFVGAEVAVGLIPDHAVVADDTAAGAAEGACRRARAGAETRAADVKRGGVQAGDESDQARQAPAVRNVVELLLIPGHRDLRGLEVDRRRLARHRDAFLQRPDFELAVHRGGDAGAEGDAFDIERRKAGEVERDGVYAAGQQREPIDTLFVGDRGTCAADQVRARDRDGHAGKRATLRVRRPAGDRAGLLLRRRRQAEACNQRHGQDAY